MLSRQTLLLLTTALLIQQGTGAAPKGSLQTHAATAQQALITPAFMRGEHAHITQVRGQAALISESELERGGCGHRILPGNTIPDTYLVVTGDGDSFVELRCPDGAMVRIWSNSILQVDAQTHFVFLHRSVAEFLLSKEDNSAYKVRTQRIEANTRASTMCLTTALSRDSVTVMDGEAKVIDLASGLPWHP